MSTRRTGERTGTSERTTDPEPAPEVDEAGRLSCPYSPNSPANVADPYPFLARARAEFPLFHSPCHRGFWLLSRYDDVAAALRDPDTFTSSVVGTTMPEITYIRDRPFIPVEVDGPAHAQYRRILSDRLSSRSVRRLEPAVRETARQLLAGLAASDRAVDLVQEFTIPLVSRVLMHAMGMPVGDAARVVDIALRLFHKRLNDPEGHRIASQELAAYVAENIAARRGTAEATDDIFGDLLAGEMGDGRPLTADEIHMYAINIFVAGFETTVNAIGSSLWHLTADAPLRARLRERPEDMGTAVEEFLRYFTPVQMFGRNLTRDLTLHGQHMADGDTVFLHYGSANRDPGAFAEPETFDPARRPNRHLAFGSRSHVCMGAHLARLEIAVAVEEVLAAFGDYTLAAEPEWAPSGDQRGLWRLPVHPETRLR